MTRHSWLCVQSIRQDLLLLILLLFFRRGRCGPRGQQRLQCAILLTLTQSQEDPLRRVFQFLVVAVVLGVAAAPVRVFCAAANGTILWLHEALGRQALHTSMWCGCWRGQFSIPTPVGLGVQQQFEKKVRGWWSVGKQVLLVVQVVQVVLVVVKCVAASALVVLGQQELEPPEQHDN